MTWNKSVGAMPPAALREFSSKRFVVASRLRLAPGLQWMDKKLANTCRVSKLMNSSRFTT